MDKKISISEDCDKLIDHEVRNEFLKHNPKFIGMRLSRNFLILKMIEYYTEKPLKDTLKTPKTPKNYIK